VHAAIVTPSHKSANRRAAPLILVGMAGLKIDFQWSGRY